MPAWDDEVIGRNIARLRGSVSQQAIATAMRSFGWKWSQATVWSIEKGERPLRLAEAADLATILTGLPRSGEEAITPNDLLVPESDPLIELELRTLRETEEAVFDALIGYLSARRVTESLLTEELPTRMREEADRLLAHRIEEFLARATSEVYDGSEDDDGESEEAPER